MAKGLLTAAQIERLLEPYVGDPGGRPQVVLMADVYTQLSVYLELILKWNARTNLTAIRDPAEIVQRHFGESLFAGRHLGSCKTLLDFGSGAGFPGVPMQLIRPQMQVTLAESQGKKAAFLREVVRVLGLQTEVWADRVERMPEGRVFDGVAMRAVDKMDAAMHEATRRASTCVLILGIQGAAYPDVETRFVQREWVAMPRSRDGVLLIARKG